MSNYDVVIIGGGSAGLSAALVLSRARRNVLVVDSGEPRNAPAAHMQGFLSRDGMPPEEFLAAGRNEVKGYGGEILNAVVSDLVQCGKSAFSVLLTDGQRITARRLLVATGLTDGLPDIPGLQERWARDVLHCPYCHGYEVRDQPLGVLGGTPDTVRYTQIIRQWSDDVVLFAPAGTLSVDHRSQLAARSIGVVEGTIQRVLVENDRLSGVQMDDGRVIPRQALFVPPRFMPNNDLLVRLGCEIDENGWPVTGIQGQTTIPGVWVAGNVANPRAQVITAAGEGSASAIAINADLVDEDIRNAVRTFNLGL
jgi:thioredoxin reductase